MVPSHTRIDFFTLVLETPQVCAGGAATFGRRRRLGPLFVEDFALGLGISPQTAQHPDRVLDAGLRGPAHLVRSSRLRAGPGAVFLELPALLLEPLGVIGD